MYIYWLGCIASVFTAWIAIKTKQFKLGNKIWAILLSGLPLFLLSALRLGIGTDYNSYVTIYNTYTSYGMRGTYEPLFYWFGRCLVLLGANAQWLIVACSAIYIYFIFYCIYEKSPAPLFSIFLLVSTTYYMSSFNTMRENVGAAVLLLSLILYEKKKYIGFVLLVLVAAGIHYSCILFLIVFLFAKIKWTVNKTVILTAVFLVARPIIVQIVNIIVAGTNYEKYIGNSDTSGMAMYFGIILQFSILVFASIYYKKDEKYNIYYSLQVIASWITLLNGIIPLASRLKWIFSLPSIILIPMAINNITKEKNKVYMSLAVIVLFFFYCHIVVGVMGSYGVVPYRSILQE